MLHVSLIILTEPVELGRVCRPPFSQPSVQCLQQLFYGIEIRGVSWPLQYLDFVVLKPIFGVVVH